jgi:D-alanine-D-alanine ligase
MRVGLTYDLRPEYVAAGFSEDETAEFDRPETVTGLENALGALGHETDRIGHARQLIARLAAGDAWDLVFNIAEGVWGIGREAQVPAILDVYGIAYTFSDPLVMSLTLHKGLTKTVVAAAGVLTPPFVVVERAADVGRIELPFPLFAKPIAEGTGKGISGKSKVENRAELAALCERLIATYQQPAIVETYLPGREFTVGITGTGESARPLGTMEIVLLEHAEAGAYSYVNKEYCDDLVEYHLVRADRDEQVRAAEQVALDAWRILGCRDAGRVDVRCDASGRANFMEVNPLAGLHPEHSDLPILASKCGVSFVELVRRIVESATPRVEEAKKSRAGRFKSVT